MPLSRIQNIVLIYRASQYTEEEFLLKSFMKSTTDNISLLFGG